MMIKKFWIIPILLALLCLPAHTEDTTQVVSPIGQTIAEAYGIDNFDQITELKYTFNATIGDKTISRSWAWMPKDNKVTYVANEDSDENFTYTRENMSNKSEDILEIDAMFINDQYWLIFPFHLVWDEGIRIEVEDEKLDLPLGSGSSTKIIVTYSGTGGYTPGDIYELYVDEKNMITKWFYRPGGSETPTRVSTWENNTQFGPIIISLDHNDPDSNFRVWFTDVEVKTN